MLQRDVVAVRVAGFAEAAPECVHEMRGDLKTGEEGHDRHRRLLCARRERPRRRAAERG
jgi:hypothetical protein